MILGALVRTYFYSEGRRFESSRGHQSFLGFLGLPAAWRIARCPRTVQNVSKTAWSQRSAPTFSAAIIAYHRSVAWREEDAPVEAQLLVL